MRRVAMVVVGCLLLACGPATDEQTGGADARSMLVDSYGKPAPPTYPCTAKSINTWCRTHQAACADNKASAYCVSTYATAWGIQALDSYALASCQSKGCVLTQKTCDPLPPNAAQGYVTSTDGTTWSECTVTACNTGYGLCGGGNACVPTNTNANCGTCGNACGAGQTCVSGTCQAGCANGLTLCSGVCRNLNQDSNNCGACGTVCGEGLVCNNGGCCQSGQTYCGGTCVDLYTDPDNCGNCGTVCPAVPNAVRQCESYTCTASCNTNYAFKWVITSTTNVKDWLSSNDSLSSYSCDGVAAIGGYVLQSTVTVTTNPAPGVRVIYDPVYCTPEDTFNTACFWDGEPIPNTTFYSCKCALAE